MYCSNCGKQIADNSAFCSYCGRPVTGQNAQQSAPQTNPKPAKSRQTQKQSIWVRLVVIVVFFLVGRFLIAPLFLEKKTSSPEVTTPAFTVPEIKFEKPEVSIPTVPEIPTTMPEIPATVAPQQDLSGSWERVNIKKNGNSYDVGAFTLNRTLKNCTQMNVEIDVTMNANTSCKDWRVWVREGGTFVEAGSIYLPNGSGSTSQMVYFSPARTFDSVAVLPAIPGGYSWSLALGLSDIICD